MSSGSLRSPQASRGPLCLQPVRTFGGFSLCWRQLWNVFMECSHECPPANSNSLQKVMRSRTEEDKCWFGARPHRRAWGGTYLAFLIGLGEASPLWGKSRHLSSLMLCPLPWLAPSLSPSPAKQAILICQFPTMGSSLPRSSWPNYRAPRGAPGAF